MRSAQLSHLPLTASSATRVLLDKMYFFWCSLVEGLCIRTQMAGLVSYGRLRGHGTSEALDMQSTRLHPGGGLFGVVTMSDFTIRTFGRAAFADLVLVLTVGHA